MGHKVSPISFRLPLNFDWKSKWFSSRNYPALLHADLAIRKFLDTKLKNASIESVNIHRGTNEINIIIKSAKPGVLIGRSGAGANDLKTALEKIAGARIRLNIEEVRKPDISAPLIAQNIAFQIEKRASYRRSMKQSIERALSGGAKGIKIRISGRLNGAEIARSESLSSGRVTLATLRSDIDYAYVTALTTYGIIGIKVWVYKGETDAVNA